MLHLYVLNEFTGLEKIKKKDYLLKNNKIQK